MNKRFLCEMKKVRSFVKFVDTKLNDEKRIRVVLKPQNVYLLIVPLYKVLPFWHAAVIHQNHEYWLGISGKRSRVLKSNELYLTLDSEIYDYGKSKLNAKQFVSVYKRNYNLFKNNCVHYAESLILFLTNSRIKQRHIFKQMENKFVRKIDNLFSQ